MNLKKKNKNCFSMKSGIVLLTSLLPSLSFAQELKLHYGLNNAGTEGIIIDESGNGFSGILKNSATTSTYDNINVIDLGTSNGYVDMGESIGNLISSLQNFSIHTKIFVPNSSNIAGNGNFIWTFSNAEDINSNPAGYMFLSAKDSRYSDRKSVG